MRPPQVILRIDRLRVNLNRTLWARLKLFSSIVFKGYVDILDLEIPIEPQDLKATYVPTSPANTELN